MSLYFFLRYGLLSILLIGWLLYQLFIKKKKWPDLKNDAFIILIFVGVWVFLGYLFAS